MNKRYIFATLMLLVTTTIFAQTISYTCDFEAGIPAGYVTHDLDANEPSRSMKSYGITLGAGWAASTDETNNTAVYSGSWYKTPAQSNDWLVTEAIRVNDVREILSWRACALDVAHPDGYKVYIGTSGQQPSDFTANPVYVVEGEQSQWQQHVLSLAPWVGQDIYIAFVNDSYNCNILALDDITIYAPENSFVFTLLTPEAISSPASVYVSGTITSSGFLPVEGYTVELIYNGESTVIDRSNDIVAVDSVATFTFELPIEVSLNETRDYTLRVSSLGGQDCITRNYSITCFARTVLIEEGTGTWCMWCPRGAYGIELMREKYGNAIVDVAIHGSDEMMDIPYYVGAYPYFTMGFPGCILDRNTQLAGDPYYDIDSLIVEAMGRGAMGRIEATAQYISSRQLSVEATVEFGKTIAEGEYGLLFIIVEDSVTGYEQANAYSGGGTEMGGYENLPDPIPADQYYFANVGRMCYPDFNGDEAAFEAGTPRHTPITVSRIIDMPVVQRMEKVKVIAAITEMATGKIVNVHEVVPSIPEAVDDVEAHKNIKVVATSQGIAIASQELLTHVEVWSVGGQLLYATHPDSNYCNIQLDNNRGVVIVKASTAQDTLVAKCVM